MQVVAQTDWTFVEGRRVTCRMMTFGLRFDSNTINNKQLCCNCPIILPSLSHQYDICCPNMSAVLCCIAGRYSLSDARIAAQDVNIVLRYIGAVVIS